MRGFRLLVLGALALAGFCAAPSWSRGQANNGNNGNNGNNNGLANAPAGVIISPAGLLRVNPVPDRTGDLTRARIAESRARLGTAVAKGSALRKISLPRLEAALAECLAANKPVPEEMKALAGLTKIQYVFYYPESKDIVIAGPAEGFFPDVQGRLLGMNTGRAVLELQDLAVALRAFPPSGKQSHVISVSIDPTQEGLARMQKFLTSIRPGPGDAESIVEGLKRSQGLHTVTVSGVSPRTHFAQVLVEADYRMKLIGIGIEPPPVKMATYIDRVAAAVVFHAQLRLRAGGR
jgi:hypothetical protein